MAKKKTVKKRVRKPMGRLFYAEATETDRLRALVDRDKNRHPAEAMIEGNIRDMAERAVKADKIEELITEIGVELLRHGSPTQRTAETLTLIRWVTHRMRENRAREVGVGEVAAVPGFGLGGFGLPSNGDPRDW